MSDNALPLIDTNATTRTTAQDPRGSRTQTQTRTPLGNSQHNTWFRGVGPTVVSLQATRLSVTYF